MEWPASVQLNEIQSRLIYDDVPTERAMMIMSEVAKLPMGAEYTVERPQGNLRFRLIAPGYFNVASA
jgi:hypothetical protein